MYTRVTHFRIRVEVASPAYLVFTVNGIINFPCIDSDTLPYTRVTRIPRLLGVNHYLNI